MDIPLDSDVAIGTQAVYPSSPFSQNENFKRAAFIPAIIGRMGWTYLTFLRAEIASFHIAAAGCDVILSPAVSGAKDLTIITACGCYSSLWLLSSG